MLDWLIDGMNLIQANNELLTDIQRRLALDNKTPEMLGFKSPTGANTDSKGTVTI